MSASPGNAGGTCIRMARRATNSVIASQWRSRGSSPRSPGSTIVVACHGGVINSYVGSVLGITSEDMWFRPNHASVHRVVAHGDRRVVRSLNEVHHLRSVDPELVSW